MMQNGRRLLAAGFLALTLGAATVVPHPAYAWGAEGHRIIALIAEHFLSPAARTNLQRMLASDTDPLSRHDLADEATWADQYRDAGNRRLHYKQTEMWHFAHVEIDGSNTLASVCQRSTDALASAGPAQDCVVHKVQEFTAELGAPGTAPAERLMALKFLLHFIGDMHQPLHLVESHDANGNEVPISAPGIGPRNPENNLHALWDKILVQRLGRNPATVANGIAQQITQDMLKAWTSGNIQSWAADTIRVGKASAYPAPTKPHVIVQINDGYLQASTRLAVTQLAMAGVRLAAILNYELGGAR